MEEKLTYGELDDIIWEWYCQGDLSETFDINKMHVELNGAVICTMDEMMDLLNEAMGSGYKWRDDIVEVSGVNLPKGFEAYDDKLCFLD